MKKYKILVLEDRIDYKGLMDFDEKLYDIQYNGLKYYKSDLKQFDLIISFNFLSDLGNFIITKAKVQGVKSLLLADGIIEWSNLFNNKDFLDKNLKLFHPILHDYFFCVGKQEAFYFNSLGQKTHNYIPTRMKNTESSKSNMNKTNKSNPGTYDFLLTTANTPYHNDAEKNILLKVFKQIIKELDNMQCSYAFRISNEFLIKELKISKSDNFIEGKFDYIFNNFKCLITTPSSIIFSAMECIKPVAQIIYRDTPLFLQSGWMITSLNIDTTIKSMLNNEKERMNFQSYQLEYYNPDKGDIKDVISLPKEKTHLTNDFNMRIYNMIQSKYNFNLEYFARKIFLKFKK
jgi:hypothetical protein